MRWGVVAADEHLGGATAWVGTVRPGERVTVTTMRGAPRRGEAHTGWAQLRSAAPFGVAERRARRPADATTLVLPRTEPLGSLPFVETTSSRETATQTEPRRGQGREYLSVREYRAGDPMRHVHWGLTARHGELMVREFEQEHTPRLAIWVDTESDDVEALDRCCTVAASIVDSATATGAGVRLLAADVDGPALVARTNHLEYHRWLARLVPTRIPAVTALGWLLDGQLQGVGTLVVTLSGVGGQAARPGLRAGGRACRPGASRRARARDGLRRRDDLDTAAGRRCGRVAVGGGRLVGVGVGRGHRDGGGLLMRLGLSGAKALPEDSIPLRVVVALAVEVGLFAVISQGVVADRTAFLALALAPAGYLLSYRRRGRPNVLVKAALAAGLLLALSRFLGQMGSVTSADAARAPLAALFVWVQVLHAFDVPRRRDLAFSMVSSTTLIAVGGALALTSSYLGILVGWAALAGAWLWLSSRPLAGDLTDPIAQVRDRSGSSGRVAAGRSLVFASIAALVLAVATFSVLPRIPATMVRALPFRMPAGAAAGPQGDHVQNPALPPQSSDGSIVDFSSNGYPGFSDVMDLRARGTLSDDIVFRVRAPFASLWRAEAFDTYDGSTWTRSSSPLIPLDSND